MATTWRARRRQAAVTGAERPGASARSSLLFPAVVLTLVVGFALAPWPLPQKAMAVLHGLCAQRPSHSYYLGGERLPFDARMTGIYGGCLVAMGYLVARGRHRRVGLPALPVIGVLAAGVVALAIDGTNSLLLDLRLWHPYTPQNSFRLLTGLAAGIALASALCFVLSTTLWRVGRHDLPVVAGRDLLPLAVMQVPFALAVVSGWSWLYAPVTVALLLGAVLAVSALALTVVVLVRHQENAFRVAREVQGNATVALLVGLLVMALIAAGRFALERWAGVPPMA